MKNIVEIVPATPGWYVRWRLTPEHTRAFPVTVWALVEEDGTHRRVVGVRYVIVRYFFVRYVFAPLDGEQPDDAFNPVKSPPK